jgi:hypothetical protein
MYAKKLSTEDSAKGPAEIVDGDYFLTFLGQIKCSMCYVLNDC